MKVTRGGGTKSRGQSHKNKILRRNSGDIVSASFNKRETKKGKGLRRGAKTVCDLAMAIKEHKKVASKS